MRSSNWTWRKEGNVMENEKWFVDDIDCAVYTDGYDSWLVPEGPFNGIRWWAEHPEEDEALHKEAMAELDFIIELVHEIERLQTKNLAQEEWIRELDGEIDELVPMRGMDW